MNERVERELALYRLREIENQDMKLKIDELRIGEQIGTMNYDENVQNSIKCKNNDYIMNEIDSLEKKIKINEIANKRVDNALKRLENDEVEIIKKVYIDKKSISCTAQEVFRSRKTVKRLIDKAFKKLRLS